MVNFPTWISDCDSHSPALLVLFLSPSTSICSTMAFPLFEDSNHVVISVSIDIPSICVKGKAPLHCIAHDYSSDDWNGLHDHLKDILWEDIFVLGASATVTEFYMCLQVGIDVYIPHHKYQVKPHLSPRLSNVCATVITHRNHVFSLHQHNKSSESKVKFRLASI